MARQMKGPHGTVRLTVDDQLRALPALDYEFRDEAGKPVLSDRVIVELKYRIALPAIFKQLIEAHALVPARVSKYRLAQDALQPRMPCGSAPGDRPSRSTPEMTWGSFYRKT